MKIYLKQTFDNLFSGFVSKTSIPECKSGGTSYTLYIIKYEYFMSTCLRRNLWIELITSKQNFQCKLTKVTRKEDLDYQEEVYYEKLFREWPFNLIGKTDGHQFMKMMFRNGLIRALFSFDLIFSKWDDLYSSLNRSSTFLVNQEADRYYSTFFYLKCSWDISRK